MSLDLPEMDENENKGEEDPDNEFVMSDNDSYEEDEYDDRCVTLVCSYIFYNICGIQ